MARIRSGGLLAYPTETLWGLGADARSEAAVERLRRWKGRPDGQPLSVLVDGVDALEALDIETTPALRALAAKFWPGPLTLVVVGRGGFARGVARADGAIGLRCSSHPLASSLARRLRGAGVGPITATSLNRHGAEPARSRAEAEVLCGPGDDVPQLIGVERADAGGVGGTTVLDLTGAEPQVLRPGLVSEAELAPVLAALGSA